MTDNVIEIEEEEKKEAVALKKRLYLIGGAMGVGKTSVCKILNGKLAGSVFLDGDWCWNADPFIVTDETEEMVMDNVTHLLNNFISCTAYKNIIFCWVMNRQEIIDGLLELLNTGGCEVVKISLVCSEETLRERLAGDIRNKLRTADITERSVKRLPDYDYLDTEIIDTTDKTPEEVAELILKEYDR